jgi:CheY-like chemotaxis protein
MSATNMSPPPAETTVQDVQQREWPAGGGKKILIVEDDLHSREGLRASLLGAGYSVDTAADGWQALKKIKEGRFEVGIIDLDLPPVHGVAVSGWDLVRIFRAFNPAISIVLMSAEAGNAVMAQLEQLQVSAFLEKPIDPARLKAIVRTLAP